MGGRLLFNISLEDLSKLWLFFCDLRGEIFAEELWKVFGMQQQLDWRALDV